MAELKEKEKKSWSLEDSKRHKERMKWLREGIKRDCSGTEDMPSIKRGSRTVPQVTSRRPGWPTQATGIPRDSVKRRPRSSKADRRLGQEAAQKQQAGRRPEGQTKKKTKTTYSIEGRLGYNSSKTISFFPSKSYLCFEIYFKEIKLFSFVIIESGDHFIFFNSLGKSLENKYFLELNHTCSIFYSRYISYYYYEDHSLFINVPYQVKNLDRTYLLVVRDLFHVILVSISHDVDPWNNCDSLGIANHHTFFQEEVVEHFQYVLTFLDTYVKNIVEKILVDKPLLVVKVLLEHLWHGLKFLFVEISFKTLFERGFGFKFIHMHYKEFLWWKEFENQIGSYFKMSGTNIYATLEQSCFDLKCLYVILDLISLVVGSFPSWTPMWRMIPRCFLEPFVENFLLRKLKIICFLKKFVCEEKFGKSWDSKNNQSYMFFDEFLDLMSKSSRKKGLSNLVLENLFIFNSILGLFNFKKNFDWMRFHYVFIHESLLKDLENKSLYSHVPLKEMKSYIMGIHGWVLGFEKGRRFSMLFLKPLSQILEENFIVWSFETFPNFLFLTLQSFQDLSFYYRIPFEGVLRIDVTTWMNLYDFLVYRCACLERNHVKLLWIVPTFFMSKYILNFLMHTCYECHGPFKEDLNI
ncbi:hypothetical protein M9H77_13069 [Catharanthus roseus]|uniref:Uncharacterized protein n=1 Tax=Catharanthus roseus TaxID=4058 RepID=A0ACC0BJ94_CATRO|nr:hypothetical protein M9H77_13069 [Catharanthus roseus]